jgi:hypothetical protein
MWDPDRIDANTFHVTDEFAFTTGTPPAVRTDVQFHINGVPVLVVETKAARLRDGDRQALGDIKYYHALLRALRQTGAEDGKQEPYLLNIVTRAEEVIVAFEDRQRTTRDTLGEALKLVAELRNATQEREASVLSPEAFAVSWFLKQEGVPKADEVARQVAAALAECPHWQTSSHQEQELRKGLYKALLAGGIPTATDYAERITAMLRGVKP